MSKKQKIILLIVLFLGTILQSLPVVRSGLNYNYGIGFWGANGHDNIWHLSLINNISNPLSIDFPTFAGEKLVNYHPFFDILISFLSKITFISTSFWLFQIFPVVSSFILLFLSFKIGQKITNKFSGGVLLIFFTTCSNSFGWIVELIKHQNLGGESMFWAMQSASNQINPPYTLSIIFLSLLILILLKIDQPRNLNTKEIIQIVILLSIIPITKAYAAVPAFIIFGFFVLRGLLKKKIQPLIILIFSIFTSVAIFLIYNKMAGGLITFSPFWFINSMIESPDRLFIPLLANMRYTLEASNKIGPRLILVQTIALGLFLIGNYGWRFIGFIQLFKKHKFYLNYFFITILFLTLIPVLFIQKGTAWNTIQFLYYALFLSNIFLVEFLINLPKNKFSKILILIIVFTTFISNIPTYQNYLGNPAPAGINYQEVEALNYLKNLPQGTVLTYPYDQYLKIGMTTPIPLYAYETTSYVAAYSKHKTYVDDYMNLSNSGYKLEERLPASTSFFEQKDIFKDRGFLVNNQISYIYLVDKQLEKTTLNTKDMYLTKVFDNQWAQIYQVQR